MLSSSHRTFLPAFVPSTTPSCHVPPFPFHLPSPCSLHSVHDDAKDKPMELELSWLSEATGWRHQMVPKERIAAAEAWAKAQIEAEEMGEDEDDDDDE